MGRYLLIAISAVSFFIYGCEAFKESYNTPPEKVLEEVGVLPATSPAGSGGTLMDVSNLECKEGLPVDVAYSAASPDVPENSGWTTAAEKGEIVSTSVEDMGGGVAKIFVSKGNPASETLALLFKDLGDGKVSVCGTLYSSCKDGCVGVPAVWSEVEKGTINMASADFKNGVFAFTYTLKFKAASTGEAGVEIAGGYVSHGYGSYDLVSEAPSK